MARKLLSITRQLQALADPRTLHDLYNVAGAEVYAQVQDGFTAETDPYGRGWVPSRAATRQNRRTLRETGALQDGIRWKADSRGIVLGTSGPANEYATYHQRGTRRLPKRQFLPEPGQMPRPYEVRISRAFNRYFTERFGA
ncbi:phage virion morphogenesis protein [Deinococcus sp. 6GRE01]|uniref:phage virion morphogenesis protein n=1 Tax=Deinococcus sp. 6GRE01 TaxID=2745873 RepID=UPI001E604B28|nr:phage virion morphogenesis protein [Deinococcus sp. 6GRE01]MCD0156016.1 phage virion morphogenesis protein [Deinococcus sp. 6GRE01]